MYSHMEMLFYAGRVQLKYFVLNQATDSSWRSIGMQALAGLLPALYRVYCSGALVDYRHEAVFIFLEGS